MTTEQVPVPEQQTQASAGSARRDGFHSLRGKGLNWEALPLRLFSKGNAKFWNPAELDFEQDRQDWAKLDDLQRDAALSLCAQFIAGEEAVTEDIQPFMAAMAAEGRFGDEMYLTQFCFEEAKHTQVFRMWLDAIGVSEDLHTYVADNPGYRAIFYEELPRRLRVLHENPSPENQVRASVTYNHVVEGVLALTGYFSWNMICATNGILPGMQRVIKLIGDDERRHMAWGTFTCRRHVAADDRLWEVVQDQMQSLLPHAMEMINYGQARFGDKSPFGYDREDLLSYASDRATRRLGAIESARGAPITKIDVDASPETLEDRFSEEDAAALESAARAK